MEFEYLGGQLVRVDQLPAEYKYINPVEGNPDGLRVGAGESISLKLTSYDRFFNKQLWTPLLGGDVFEIVMTRPAGIAAPAQAPCHSPLLAPPLPRLSPA